MESEEKTLELFNEGKSITEIASERELAASTIETHLAILLLNKKITIDDLLPEDKIELIKKAVPENPKTLTEIKELLPKEVTFGEIRLFLASTGKLKEKRFSKTPPIVRAMNTYRGNNCHRKCFNHESTIADCGAKFEQAARSYGNGKISISDFYSLVNTNQLKICKFQEKQRKQAITWNKFEQMKDAGKDLWDEGKKI
ncbi:MAG: hypothetical protein COV47_01345 [Candidatus Diapherotrites archaeon CG11_big_fil_rev_8_21_14_0_20_37_9]|nr:MAG: hypothetical protein COV47_01345 [Candidatus Diapherotrites archaeon CG11_big_fil_rev_8_21_14_0_20_37_9]